MARFPDRSSVAAIVALCVLPATPVVAQDYGDPSGKSLIVAGDIRVIAADGERSWLDGGFGKSRFGPDRATPADRLVVDPRPIEATLAWQPHLSWSLGATIVAIAQDGQEHAVDLSEAFLSWRRDPHGVFRLSGRAGLFWPPVSLEHSGPEWAVTDTITPSAINSWIGEEVKVGGVETTASTTLGETGRLTATLAVFGFNDTAGTLLAYRGWALHDEKATAFGRQPLPPLDPFSQDVQAQASRPVVELDNRPGYYARLGWMPGAALKLHALYYDNRGNPEAVTSQLQWGWRTRFVEAGGVATIGQKTRLTAQAITGKTREGFPMPDRIWADTRFRSAFALVTRQIGPGSVSSRIEAFGTRGRGSVLGRDESEDGWAATLAAKRPFGRHVTLLAEGLHVESRRDARTRGGLDPRQGQTVLQLALRLHS